MGWPAQGIAPKFQGPVGINSACRSSFGDAVATADDWGVVKLFRFPCITPGARCKRYGGHSARVGRVRFSFEEKTVLTTGLVDGLVMQWRYLSTGKLAEVEAEVSDDEDEMELEKRGAGAAAGKHAEEDDSDVEQELGTQFGRGTSKVKVDKAGMVQVASERMVTGNEAVMPGVEEQRLNIKSGVMDEAEMERGGGREWRKPMDADEAPYNCLQLEHVYGYRGHDCRNNLVYTAAGNIVYMAGAVAIVYRKTGHVQHFYSAHTDDIVSLALHPDKVIIATGQVGKAPIVNLWSAETMATLSTLRGFHERGVASVGFNKDGTKVATVGLDLDHSIAVWDWRKGTPPPYCCPYQCPYCTLNGGGSGTRIATAMGSSDKIFDAQFNPVDDVLVTCGVRHIKFWNIVGDNQLKAKRGIYGQEGVQHTMLCVAFTDAGLSLTGAQSGDIYLWKGARLEWQFEEAHVGPVFAISTYPDGFVSGGKDGRARLWSGLDPVKVFDFSSTSVSSMVATRIRSVAWRDGHVLVGTMSNEIFEVDERTMTQRLLTQSHAGAEVWALDTHPAQAVFATGGEDKTVRVYRVSSRKPLLVRELEAGVRSVAYNHDGSLLACGLVTGQVVVLEPRRLEQVCARHARATPILDLKFSPDGRFLATASGEGALDVYEALVDFELVGTASTAEGCALTHLDWSADGQYIQTDNSAREHQYWDALSVVEKRDADEMLSRTEWASWTCVAGWSVQGLAPKLGVSTGVNAVARSNAGDVLAVANDMGLVRLYRFPCPYMGSKHKRFAGHSSQVSNCRFTCDDRYLITVGAQDKCIFQWEHVSD
jgi:microtubule-associated protein-like 6